MASPFGLYRSNDGHGSYKARVLSVEGDVVTLIRSRTNGKPGEVKFALLVSFFDSPACGWVPWGMKRERKRHCRHGPIPKSKPT